MLLIELGLDLTPVGVERLELIGVKLLRVGQGGLVSLECSRGLCRCVLDGFLRGAQRGLRGVEVSLCRTDSRSSGHLCSIETLLRVVDGRLGGIDLCL